MANMYPNTTGAVISCTIAANNWVLLTISISSIHAAKAVPVPGMMTLRMNAMIDWFLVT